MFPCMSYCMCCIYFQITQSNQTISIRKNAMQCNSNDFCVCTDFRTGLDWTGLDQTWLLVAVVVVYMYVCMYEYCVLKWKQWKGKHNCDELNYNTNLRSLLFYCIVYLQYILIYIMYWYTFCIRIAINHKPRCIYYTFMYFTNQIPATRHYHQKLIPWMIGRKC